MADKKHIHLIGICGTAMASLAGMLKQRGFKRDRLRRRGVSAHVDVSGIAGIPVAQPFAAANLSRDLIWLWWGMRSRAATSNWNICSTSEFRSVRCHRSCTKNFCAAKKCWLCRVPMARPQPPRCWPGSSIAAGVQPSFPDWRHCGEFRIKLHSWEGKHFILEGDEYDTAFFDKGPKVPALFSRCDHSHFS